MASTYSTNLKLELMGTGDQSGTWGNTTNTNLGTLVEQAIVGYTTQAITDGADTVITISNGTSSVARNYVLQLTGTLTANRNLIVPALQKNYIIYNATTGGFSVTVKVSGQTGVTVANGKKAIVYNNGTDVIEVVNAAVTEAGTQTLTNKTLSTGTAITAGTINSASVGATTPSTGAFTTLSASSTVSGAGFSTYLASPPAIGGTTPAAGTFTTLGGTTITASVQFSGPHNGTVGATTPSTGAFTTLSASSTVSGTGFSNYLASPPAIGGTAAAAGTFTTLTATTLSARILPRVTSTTTATSLTPNSDSVDVYAYTALASAITVNADGGNPSDGQKLIFRFLDNGTARVITFTGGVSKGFINTGVNLTASASNWTYTTTANKKTYVGCIYNSSASRWDVVALSQEA